MNCMRQRRICNKSGSSSASLPPRPTGGIFVDYQWTKLDRIPAQWIHAAKGKLQVACNHTSRGSQLVTGMEGLVMWILSFSTAECEFKGVCCLVALGEAGRVGWALGSQLSSVICGCQLVEVTLSRTKINVRFLPLRWRTCSHTHKYYTQ